MLHLAAFRDTDLSPVPALWRTALNVVGLAFVFSPRHSLSKLSSAHLA